MSIREQVHCCLLETCVNCCLLQSIQDGPYSGSWKVSCFQDTCVGWYVSYGIDYLCTVFRAIRGKSVLGKKEEELLKWGFHLSHAVCFPTLFWILGMMSFVEKMLSAPEKWTLMGPAVLLLFDWGVWGEKLNNFKHKLKISLGIWLCRRVCTVCVCVYDIPKDDWVVSVCSQLACFLAVET